MKRILNRNTKVDTETGEVEFINFPTSTEDVSEDITEPSLTDVSEVPPTADLANFNNGDNKNISVDILTKAVDLISETFNLKDKLFTVRKFDDKISTVTVMLTNTEFELTVKINDVYGAGIREL